MTDQNTGNTNESGKKAGHFRLDLLSVAMARAAVLMKKEGSFTLSFAWESENSLTVEITSEQRRYSILYAITQEGICSSVLRSAMT